MSRGGVRMNWKGRQVVARTAEQAGEIIAEFGLRAEAHAKRELQKGHGVLTGTLRRSIHTAEPDYDFSADDVEPSNASPERGNQRNVRGQRVGNRISVLLGSGLSYALAVHQGHGSFTGYHYLTIGVERALPELPDVIERHRL